MQAFSIILMRVLAIYIVVSPLYAITFSVLNIHTSELDFPWLPTLLVSFAMPILIGAVLWLKAPTIARKMHGSDPQDNVAITEGGLVRVGSFLIGIYLFAQRMGTLIDHWQWSERIDYGSLAILILSLALILGASFMEKLYQRFRNF